MLVTPMTWNRTTNKPPATFPKNIMPMPNGIVTIPLPVGSRIARGEEDADQKEPAVEAADVDGCGAQHAPGPPQ